MAAMHEDNSPDLTEVARILKDVLEVNILIIISSFGHQIILVNLIHSIAVYSQSCQLGAFPFQISDVPLKVRKLVVNVCDVVVRRAARLAAAGIVGILKKIGRDGSGGIASGRTRGGSSTKMRRTVVAVEGGLYTSYTMFREYLNEAVAEILGEEISPYVILKVMEDGSGIGAALLAASHSAPSVDTVQLL